MILVYHSVATDAMHYGTVETMNSAKLLRRLDEGGFYKHVANVESDDMNDAYRLTNHIDSPWMENEGVDTSVESARSTSVGDLLICKDGIYAVAPFGFDKIRSFGK